MREAAESRLSIVPFTMQENIIEAKKPIVEEAISIMHVAQIESCCVVFVDATNLNDLVITTIARDDEYFSSTIDRQLRAFEKHALIEVLRKSLIVQK